MSKFPDFKVLPLVGASIASGIEHAKQFKKLKLGDIVLTSLPVKRSEALALMKHFRAGGIYVILSEMIRRGSFDRWGNASHFAGGGIAEADGSGQAHPDERIDKRSFDEIIAAAGEYYIGRYSIGEAGGVLYWPKSYTIDRRAGVWRNLPPCEKVDEAHEAYIKYLRQFIDFERNKVGCGNLLNVESSMLFKYHAEAGIDMLCLEMLPGDPLIMLPAIRGAAKSFDMKWGVHIAMACYGGMRLDELWLKRWKTSLYYSFISGASFVFPESGHYEYKHGRKNCICGFHHPKMKASRLILREFWRFVKINSRPKSGPETAVGIVSGNHDGAPGLWNPYAWGQYAKDEMWESGPAEDGWELLSTVFRSENCFSETFTGNNSFSGNPPFGQYDIVPAESPIEKIKEYKCLVFLGWNTMTPEIYGKLIQYVISGGHLVMWLAHLNVETGRRAEIRLFNGGNIKELFGVEIGGREKSDVMGVKCFNESFVKSYKYPVWRPNSDPRFIGKMTPAKVKISGNAVQVISGFADYFQDSIEELEKRPALIEHKLGKGAAWLITAYEYPGARGMRKFAENILRVVLLGEQQDIRLLCSDRIRYAVYGSKTGREYLRIIYALNTEVDVSQSVRVWLSGKITGEIAVPPNEMKVIYIVGNAIVLCPESMNFKIHSLQSSGEKISIGFFNLEKQQAEIFNLSDKTVNISLNDVCLKMQPGKSGTLKCLRKVDAARREFYVKNFLTEPKIKFFGGKLPY